MLVFQVAGLLQAEMRFPNTETKKDADYFKNVQSDESCLSKRRQIILHAGNHLIGFIAGGYLPSI